MNQENRETRQPLGTQALFEQYIDVVNRAIQHNKDGLYGKAARVWERIIGDRQIAVGIYKSDASNPHQWYTLELRHGRLELLGEGKTGATLDWKISEDHLEHVVHDPHKYIESPVKLDLDWLVTRVGLG
ncbi:MAG: hypothetical protein R6X02_22925 [Enhygromyxa sp.]